MTEPIRPSVWRRANRNTALSVRAVVIARDEYCGWPPRVVRGSACQAAIAASENQTVRLPRWRKAASYSAQFVTRRRCFGIRWRRAALALNGIGGSRVTEGGILLRQPPLHANRPIRATNSRRAPSRGSGHRAAALDGCAERGGRDGADPAGSAPATHCRARPHGRAEGLWL